MLGRGLGRVTYRNEGSLLCRVKKLGGQHLRKRVRREGNAGSGENGPTSQLQGFL